MRWRRVGRRRAAEQSCANRKVGWSEAAPARLGFASRGAWARAEKGRRGAGAPPARSGEGRCGGAAAGGRWVWRPACRPASRSRPRPARLFGPRCCGKAGAHVAGRGQEDRGAPRAGLAAGRRQRGGGAPVQQKGLKFRAGEGTLLRKSGEAFLKDVLGPEREKGFVFW